MTIRRLIPADAAAFQALRLAALSESPTAFSSSPEEERDTPLAVIEARMQPDSGRHYFGAYAQGQLAGIVVLGRDSARKTAHKVFIRGMYIAPAQRGTGLGRRLIEQALTCARTLDGVRSVMLSATAGNAAAIALYRSLGFEEYGCEPGAMLVDGRLYDEVLMALQLHGKDRTI